MKSYRTYYILLFSCVTLLQGTGNVNSVTKVATAAANWLKLETGTRAIGMGGAYTSVGKGIQGVPYNPASLSYIKNSEGFFSVTNYFAGINYSVLGFATNMSGVDHAGIHVFALDSGDMDVTTEEYPDGTGEQFKMTGLCLRGTYSKIITNRLRIGFTGKYIREQIYTAYMQSFALDIGSRFDTGLFGFMLGMSINNLGPEVKYGGDALTVSCDAEASPTLYCDQQTEFFPLPLTFRLGVSNYLIGPESTFLKSDKHRFLISMDAINPIDYTLYSAIGMEYTFSEMFFLRFGTHFGHDTANTSLGAGLQMNSKTFSIGLDYAYVNYGVLDYTHQFGLNFEF